jgi:transcriptional regulator with XRE-family HTH domain
MSVSYNLLSRAISYLKKEGKIKNQEDLASQIGVSSALISQVIRDKKGLSLELINKIETKFKIKLMDLEYTEVGTDEPIPSGLEFHLQLRNDVIKLQQELISKLMLEREELIRLIRINQIRVKGKNPDTESNSD